jgi:hypothetical protein
MSDGREACEAPEGDATRVVELVGVYFEELRREFGAQDAEHAFARRLIGGDIEGGSAVADDLESDGRVSERDGPHDVGAAFLLGGNGLEELAARGSVEEEVADADARAFGAGGGPDGLGDIGVALEQRGGGFRGRAGTDREAGD